MGVCVSDSDTLSCAPAPSFRWRSGSRTGGWSGRGWRAASRGRQPVRRSWWTWRKGRCCRRSSRGSPHCTTPQTPLLTRTATTAIRAPSTLTYDACRHTHQLTGTPRRRTADSTLSYSDAKYCARKEFGWKECPPSPWQGRGGWGGGGVASTFNVPILSPYIQIFVVHQVPSTSADLALCLQPPAGLDKN